MRIKQDILKQLKTISVPEIKDIFSVKGKKAFTINRNLEDRLTTLVNTIAGKKMYDLGRDGFSGSKQSNSITFYLGSYDVEVVFTKRGSIKDFFVDKTACELGGLI
jgi:hypothetical protein